MTEKWSKPLSLRFNPLISFSVTVIPTSVTVRHFGNERVYIEGEAGKLKYGHVKGGTIHPACALMWARTQTLEEEMWLLRRRRGEAGGGDRRVERLFLLRHQP